jgi:hypothetical protein
MARVDDCRAASQFHTQANPEPGAPVDLTARRAQVEDAADKRRQAEHDTLTRAARADYVPGGRRSATVEDVARSLSPEYADRVEYGERLGGLIARTEKAMQHQEGIARGRENGVELRWWRLSLAQKTLHVTGVWRDQRLDQYQNGAAGAWRSHHRLALRRGTLTAQLSVNERLAAAAFEKVRLEAERVLLQRQQKAEAARAALAAIRDASRDRSFERTRTRGTDHEAADERTQNHHRGRGR